MLFTTLDWLLSLPVGHIRQPVALKWDGGRFGLVSTLFFQQNYLFSELINIFYKRYLIQIKRNKMISKYKTMHILLTNVYLDCRGRVVSSNRNASRDESVETGDESVETGDESIEAGEKHNNHVIISDYPRVVHYLTHDCPGHDLLYQCLIWLHLIYMALCTPKSHWKIYIVNFLRWGVLLTIYGNKCVIHWQPIMWLNSYKESDLTCVHFRVNVGQIVLWTFVYSNVPGYAVYIFSD